MPVKQGKILVDEVSKIFARTDDDICMRKSRAFDPAKPVHKLQFDAETGMIWRACDHDHPDRATDLHAFDGRADYPRSWVKHVISWKPSLDLIEELTDLGLAARFVRSGRGASFR